MDLQPVLSDAYTIGKNGFCFLAASTANSAKFFNVLRGHSAELGVTEPILPFL
jgi:hypothetical protein